MSKDDLLAHIGRKVFSGRWIMSLAASLVFVNLASRQILAPEQVMQVILIVITFYFAQRGPPPVTP